MKLDQKNRKLWLVAAIVVAALAFILCTGLFGKSESEPGSGESAIVEDSRGESGVESGSESASVKEDSQGQSDNGSNSGNVKEQKNDKTDPNDTSRQSDDTKEQTDGKGRADDKGQTDDKDQSTGATILEDQGNIEIIIPDDMGTGGF